MRGYILLIPQIYPNAIHKYLIEGNAGLNIGEHTVAVQVPYGDKDRAKEIQVTGAKRELYIT